MDRRRVLVAAVVAWLGVFVFAAVTHGQQGSAPAAAQSRGWLIPPNGAAEKSPLTVNDTVLAAGKKLFAGKCERCHGEAGRGDGPDGDPENQSDMDLTVAARAARNSDGTIFYKIWNGRSSPKMPAFSDQLSKEQAWSIVAYVQTLRAK